MRCTITIESIEELMKRWELIKKNEGIKKVKITEQGLLNKSFIVQGLEMELENEYAMCSDYNDMLIENLSILLMFLKDDLKDIKLIPIDNGYKECLKFAGNEIVYIEKVS